MEIREETRRVRENRASDFGTKNALARIVRRRWPGKTVASVMAEWSLSEGEARGVVYAQASQATLDKIKRHPNGGWRLALEIDALVIGQDLETFIIAETKRLADERRRHAEQSARMVRLARDLGAVFDLDHGDPLVRDVRGHRERRSFRR